jgi:glutathione synthase/RimK-type ligase-like ATP-grasp enzyme
LRGISSVAMTTHHVDPPDEVLPKGERWAIPGRMNLSAGATMVLEAPRAEHAAFAMARQARRALGLRVAAVDLFTDSGGDPEAMRLIEVNSNPSIRFLEHCDRPDLILKIWHHTFAAMGLLVV